MERLPLLKRTQLVIGRVKFQTTHLSFRNHDDQMLSPGDLTLLVDWGSGRVSWFRLCLFSIAAVTDYHNLHDCGQYRYYPMVVEVKSLKRVLGDVGDSREAASLTFPSSWSCLHFRLPAPPPPSSKPSDSIFSLWFCFPLPPSSHHLLSIILTFLPPSFKDLCDYISALAVSSRIVLLLSRALTSSHLQSPFAMYISTAQGLGCGHLWLATIQLPTSRERKTTTGKVTSVPEEILFRRWSHRGKPLGLGFPQSQPNQQ